MRRIARTSPHRVEIYRAILPMSPFLDHYVSMGSGQCRIWSAMTVRGRCCRCAAPPQNRPEALDRQGLGLKSFREGRRFSSRCHECRRPRINYRSVTCACNLHDVTRTFFLSPVQHSLFLRRLSLSPSFPARNGAHSWGRLRYHERTCVRGA
jgi:hypothetical protein